MPLNQNLVRKLHEVYARGSRTQHKMGFKRFAGIISGIERKLPNQDIEKSFGTKPVKIRRIMGFLNGFELQERENLTIPELEWLYTKAAMRNPLSPGKFTRVANQLAENKFPQNTIARTEGLRRERVNFIARFIKEFGGSSYENAGRREPLIRSPTIREKVVELGQSMSLANVAAKTGLTLKSVKQIWKEETGGQSRASTRSQYISKARAHPQRSLIRSMLEIPHPKRRDEHKYPFRILSKVFNVDSSVVESANTWPARIRSPAEIRATGNSAKNLNPQEREELLREAHNMQRLLMMPRNARKEFEGKLIGFVERMQIVEDQNPIIKVKGTRITTLGSGKPTFRQIREATIKALFTGEKFSTQKKPICRQLRIQPKEFDLAVRPLCQEGMGIIWNSHGILTLSPNAVEVIEVKARRKFVN